MFPETFAAFGSRPTTLLVTGAIGFYNPRNVASEARNGSGRNTHVQPPRRRVVHFEKECLNIHSTLRISQEQ
jgi:hypothetical protein